MSSALSVVAAAINRDGRVLAVRRRSPADLAGQWEFPGGKVELGESDQAALARELLEELRLTVVVGPLLGRVAIRTGLDLALYACDAGAGQPVLGPDHSELRWIPLAELDDLPWIPVDRSFVPVIRRWVRGGVPAAS
jgi:8-oxo-dGTP diphosphatase